MEKDRIEESNTLEKLSIYIYIYIIFGKKGGQNFRLLTTILSSSLLMKSKSNLRTQTSNGQQRKSSRAA